MIVGAGLVLLLLVADVSSGGSVTHLDLSVVNTIAVSEGGPQWAQTCTDLGSLGVSGAVVMIATLVCAHQLCRLWPLALTAFNVAATGLVVSVLKAAVGRPAPPAAVSDPGYSGYFPSGHTATALVCFGTAAFLALALLRPDLSAPDTPRSGPAGPQAGWDSLIRVAVGAGLVVGVVVGLGTVLTGNHWPSDIVGGLLVGTVVLVTGFAATRTHVARAVGVRR